MFRHVCQSFCEIHVFRQEIFLVGRSGLIHKPVSRFLNYFGRGVTYTTGCGGVEHRVHVTFAYIEYGLACAKHLAKG